MTTVAEDFINKRALSLSPQDSVLFMYNLASDNNLNNQDISVGAPVAIDAQGLTEVILTGLNNKGLTGVGPIVGTTELRYYRSNLAMMGLPTDGTFFDIFRGEPTFLGSVAEFIRRTSFNCSAADFNEEAFYPDDQGVRRLKAKASSWRFIGEVVLGRPKRDDLETAIPQTIRANLSSYDGIFVNNANRLTSGLIISHRSDDYNRLAVGMALTSFSDALITFIIDHLRRKNINVVFSATQVTAVNLYGLKVVYKGPLRIGDVAPTPDLTNVIALAVPAPTGLWSGGEIKLFYNPAMTRYPSQVSSTVYLLGLVPAAVQLAPYAAMLNGVAVGTRYDTVGSARNRADLFKLVTGIDYTAERYGQLKVSYNGPNRPIDQLPQDVLACKVIEFVNDGLVPVAVAGPLKILYRT